jgi:hypothetical protein
MAWMLPSDASDAATLQAARTSKGGSATNRENGARSTASGGVRGGRSPAGFGIPSAVGCAGLRDLSAVILGVIQCYLTSRFAKMEGVRYAIFGY